VAALTPDQISLFFDDGRTDRFCLFSIRRANTSDTVDVSAWFKDAKLAVVLWTTTAKRDALTAPAANIVTLSSTGLANDAGWLAVWGTGV
jgi:hypothetical protein